jgi:hypothetical protein
MHGWKVVMSPTNREQYMRDAARTISALCNAPHWTADRRWTIARYAQMIMDLPQ